MKLKLYYSKNEAIFSNTSIPIYLLYFKQATQRRKKA